MGCTRLQWLTDSFRNFLFVRVCARVSTEGWGGGRGEVGERLPEAGGSPVIALKLLPGVREPGTKFTHLRLQTGLVLSVPLGFGFSLSPAVPQPLPPHEGRGS